MNYQMFYINQPMAIDEFRLEIPLYLREKDRNQMEFIDDIFEIIEVNS